MVRGVGAGVCGNRFGLADSVYISQFARARSLRGDSITDEWSKLDFVEEVLVRPMSSNTTSVICIGRLLFTLQQ
jgi:hypothetical protein